ncbi:MAG: DNA mismatch repair protein MutS [Candidatus Hydrogenedentota bacterium]
MSDHTPEETYRKLISHNQSHADKWSRYDSRVSNARLFFFIAILVVACVSQFTGIFHIKWTLLPAAIFIGLIIYHATVIQRLRDAQVAIRFYRAGIDRVQDTWMGQGDASDTWKPAEHPYAADLDLFGEGSLFELLNTTRTRIGGATLASWLLAAADSDSVVQRQIAVEELRGKLDFRERIALTAGEIQSDLHPIRLRHWAEAPIRHASSLEIWLPRFLTIVSVVCFVLLFKLDIAYSYIPFMSTFIVNMIVLRAYVKRVIPITQKLDGAIRDLRLFVHLARIFEQESFNSALLQRHQQRLVSGEQNASTAIRRLTKLFTWMELHRNQMFYPFGVMCFWIVHFAHLIEGWRERFGKDVPGWMESLGEIEALSALAVYAYEHPDDPFPEFLEGEPSQIIASELKHPLLPATTSVSNSVRLDSAQSLLIVSGSNMSGKSTYLRTIGVNIVLAMAGAPVRCASMRLTPCVVGASLHVQDSIQSGISHFYAEILRLKSIVGLADGERPLVFLIDEILHGTNSHDRRIGTQGVIDELLGTKAVGLITTHDLALTSLQTRHNARIVNVHFRDDLDGDQLTFDYCVREGVVARSNALELMRSIGLKIRPVDE